ncbi:MAG: hypothetical protein A2293_10580 [Elusimicrobia bacterium RIFOXYB2_FULL_49_7]|nr:MAG: hypothetical protein A2293_10580 [Elusimicrobia bacterium RIFOXYB2_FULL_49_7]
MKRQNNRWYDHSPALARCLDGLKTMSSAKRKKLVVALLEMICKKNPELIGIAMFKFPLDPHSRRWFDKNPYLWLLFHSLKNADSRFLRKVVNFFRHEI